MQWLNGIIAFVAAGAAAATTLGFVIGAVSAVIAVAGYLRSGAHAESSHMHGLFRDYLRLRIDAGTTLTAEKVLSFKLYTLEEMYAWVRREQRWAWSSNRRSTLAGWRSTIVRHLKEERTGALASLRASADCYGNAFLLLAADVLDAEDLRRWVEGGRDPAQLAGGDVETAIGHAIAGQAAEAALVGRTPGATDASAQSG